LLFKEGVQVNAQLVAQQAWDTALQMSL